MKKDSRNNKRSQVALVPLQANALAAVNGGATWTAPTWGTQAWRWWQ